MCKSCDLAGDSLSPADAEFWQTQSLVQQFNWKEQAVNLRGRGDYLG
jgi:hypothetical protein